MPVELTGGRPWTAVSASEAETEALGGRLARALHPRGTLLLDGEMGSGKTVLVRGMARALGVDPREVQSPTYTLIHEHRGTLPAGEATRLVHVDLYRVEPADLPALGLEELLAGSGVKAVEWAERLAADLLPTTPAAERGAAWRVTLAGSGTTRQIRVVPGPAAVRRS